MPGFVSALDVLQMLLVQFSKSANFAISRSILATGDASGQLGDDLAGLGQRHRAGVAEMRPVTASVRSIETIP